LTLAGGNDGITRDQLREDTTGGLDTESKRVDVDEDHVARAFITSEDSALDGRAVRDGLIGVDTLGGFLSEVVLEELLNLGNTGRTTDEDDFVDILLLNVSVLKNLLDRFQGLTEEVHVNFLELGAREGFREIISVLEAFNLDPDALLTGQGTLGLLDFALKLAKSSKILGNIGAGFLLVAFDQVVHYAVVEIFTTEMSVTSSCQDLKDTVVDREERNIKGTTTEIVDDDLGLALLLVKTVGDSSGGRFINDTEDVKTGDRSGILCCLALSVVEV